jgi:tyrosyl-tRNA synthetase
LKIFTVLTKIEIEQLVLDHAKAPHTRILQNKLAEELTCMVHGKQHHDISVNASQILFGKGTKEQLQSLDQNTFNAVFQGVPNFIVNSQKLKNGINIIDLLSDETQIFKSKGEIRRLIKENGLSLNLDRVTDPDWILNEEHLINHKYIVIRQGKKNYSIITTL